MQLPLELRFQSCKLSDEQFWLLCQDNRELRLERNSQGDLEIMPPTGGVSGHINAKLTQRLANWAETDGTGIGEMGRRGDGETGRWGDGEIKLG
jgi:Uma2 family endonuclease